MTQHIEMNPDFSPKGSVIWLHGLGADGNDFAPIAQELGLMEACPIRFVFPHAPHRPVTINNGYVMRAWYDIVSMSFDQRADQKGIDESVAQLSQLILDEVKRGIPYEKIVLAGFSQGAVIALTTGLMFPKKLGGILALSGYLPNEDKVIHSEFSAVNKATPVFLAHGTEDTVVPFAMGERIRAALETEGYPVSWHSYAMAHSVCGNEIQDISQWLMQVFL